MPSFEKAINFVLKWEGGYNNIPADPGGETNWGISKKAHPHLDIKKLTKDQAKAIYQTDYWDKIRGDELPSYALALTLLDFAVNFGPGRAIQVLQKALGVKVDGVFGDETMKAIKASTDYFVTNKINDYRLEFYVRQAGLFPTKKIFLLGWLRRLFDLQREI